MADDTTQDITHDPGTDPYADLAAILERVKKLEQRWGAPRPRRPFLMAAERNIRFLNADQWLSPAMGGAIGWRPANLKKGTPTPVTNRYAEVTKAFSSMLSRFEPSLNYRPATEDPDDLATAEVAERLMDVIDDEVKIVPIRQTLSNWVTHTGGAWTEDGYDPSPEHGMVEIPMDACQSCGTQAMPTQDATCAAPGCGGPTAPAVDPTTGQPVTKPVPRGAMYTDIVNLFEMLFDFTITDPAKHRAFIRKKSLDVDRAKERWPEFKDTITADSIAGNFLTSDGLSMITPNLDDAGPLRYQQYGTGSVNNRVTETWYWQLPDDTYPDGLLSISIGRSNPLSVHAGPLPYYFRREDGTKKYFLPFTFFAQEFIPGSAWPRTVMNDVALKQAQRNKCESQIEQAQYRMANHVWLIPNGSNVQQLTGDMGLVINWNAIGSAGHAKPERIQGLPIPQSFYENLDRIDKSIDGLAHCLTGDTNVPCLDGKSRSMEELARDYPNGGDMWVYGFDRETLRVVPAKVQRAWPTGLKRCVRVTFKEGTSVDCSFDHPFLTWTRGYVKAEDLKPDEAIVPLKLYGDQRSGYSQVMQPVESKCEPIHRMVAYALHGLTRGTSQHMDVHHIDRDKRNNLPFNLEVLTRGEHTKQHPTKWKHFEAPRPPEMSAYISQRMTKQWARLTPIERLARLSSMHEAVRTEMRKMTPEERSERNRLRRWGTATPEERQAAGRRMRSGWNLTHEQRSEVAKRRWERLTPDQKLARIAKLNRKQGVAVPNHRVSSVVHIGDHEVYDLQTSTHNFGLEAGVFVHNTLDVLRGARPAGVTAGITLQILKERGESLFGPMFVLWHNSWAERASKVVEIFRLFATEDRLTQIMGKNGKWKVEKFSSADLQGNINVIPEAGISLPRSTMTDRAEIEQLVAMHAVNVLNPETNYEILKHYGKTSLSPGMRDDEQNAAIEDEQFVALAQHPAVANEPPTSVASMRQFVGTLQAQGAEPTVILAQVEAKFASFGIPIPRLRPTIDDNAVHARDQRTFAKTEEFRALPEIVQFFVELHIAAHAFLVGQAQMAAMQASQGQTATSNMLQRPRSVSPGTPSPMSSSSSGNRMQGDHAEMERTASTPGQ